eukprot:CAMPEP_0118925322 /NCGR_PEP_ID=MMETSP1169-20130426/3222_1 /TAXON_ID=36882 /ORGANISM="Pyramimonas obovata, Strain CCMP722" /LENGTH=78 /DNA_ID=CAMNT_0006866575 /DNA_START=303 /DNA_END=536 /DNA_ORIENTATION=-
MDTLRSIRQLYLREAVVIEPPVEEYISSVAVAAMLFVGLFISLYAGVAVLKFWSARTKNRLDDKFTALLEHEASMSLV